MSSFSVRFPLNKFSYRSCPFVHVCFPLSFPLVILPGHSFFPLSSQHRHRHTNTHTMSPLLFLNLLRVNYLNHDFLSLKIFCAVLQSRDIFLHNHSIVINSSKFIIDTMFLPNRLFVCKFCQLN